MHQVLTPELNKHILPVYILGEQNNIPPAHITCKSKELKCQQPIVNERKARNITKKGRFKLKNGIPVQLIVNDDLG